MPKCLTFFEYELQYGDAASALKEPYSVVLTRKAANKLFKEENPIGQTIKVGDIGTYTITGILKETENKSHIVFEALASISTVNNLPNKNELTEWTNYWVGWTYTFYQPLVNRAKACRLTWIKYIHATHC
jgi:putative ABC transport system permease protein